MLIYISGAISNDPDYRNKFAKAEKYLTDKGHEVINPAKVAESLPELKYEQYMHIDEALIDICDAVYFLKDWGQSKGAREEYAYVNDLNKLITRLKMPPDDYMYIKFNEMIDRDKEPIKLIFEGDNEDEL
jgi:hypothetical protein